MKHYTFYRENDKFDDILNDRAIKKHIYVKIRWKGYLRIGLYEINDKIESYITLKYGDEMRNNCLVTDRTPVPFKDYSPKQPRWFKS